MADDDDDDLADMGFASAPATPAKEAPAAEPAEEEAPPSPSPAASPRAAVSLAPAPAESPPPPEPASSVATAPAEPPAPVSTPAPAETIVVVDVEPSPGAMKFLNTMGNVSAQVSTLESTDVSDGMLELSKKCKTGMQESFSTFKDHALDLAISASAAEPPADGRLRTTIRNTEWKKMGQLPVAAFYALAALICLVCFAAVYYPKMYGPLLVDKAKTKFIEWKVAEKATTAKEKVVPMMSSAYTAAASSQLAAKGAEYATVGYSKANEVVGKIVTNPAVVQTLAKGTEAADKVRAKVADKLVEIKRSSSPVGNGV